MTLVTKLFYEEGLPDSLPTTIPNSDWRPCTLVDDSGLQAVKVKQASRKKAGRGPIVAASYFRDSEGSGLVLVRTIPVR